MKIVVVSNNTNTDNTIDNHHKQLSQQLPVSTLPTS